MVVNRSNGRGVFGQPNGSFSVYVNNGDTIALSVKDYPLYTVIVEADSNCQCKRTIYIEGRPQEVTEVVVRPLKTLDQIKEERAALAMRETRMVTGIEALQSPITALYQAFSKVERNKRWMRLRDGHAMQIDAPFGFEFSALHCLVGLRVHLHRCRAQTFAKRRQNITHFTGRGWKRA